MTMPGVKACLLFVSAMVAALPAFSANPDADKELTHYTIFYPPYWDGTASQPTGLHARLARKLYAQARLDIKMESVPYNRIHQSLFPANVAIAAYGSNEKTNNQYLFPIPKTASKLNIYGIHAQPIDTLEQLQGKRIAIKRGFPLAGYAKTLQGEPYQAAVTHNIEQAIRLLESDRIDYFVTLDGPFERSVRNLKLEHKNIWGRTLLKLEGWPIAVVKAHPRAQELHDKIKKAYEELQDSGVVTYKNNQLLLTEDL